MMNDDPHDESMPPIAKFALPLRGSMGLAVALAFFCAIPASAASHAHGVLGGRWVGVQEVRGGQVHRFAGAGFSFEPPHGNSEVGFEFAAAVTRDGQQVLVPVEVMALHPSHPMAWLEPFVGVGLGVDVSVSPNLLARPAAVVCSGARVHVVDDLDMVVEVSAHAPLAGGSADIQAAAGLAIHLP